MVGGIGLMGWRSCILDHVVSDPPDPPGLIQIRPEIPATLEEQSYLHPHTLLHTVLSLLPFRRPGIEGEEGVM